jgi:hypothetical protein
MRSMVGGTWDGPPRHSVLKLLLGKASNRGSTQHWPDPIRRDGWSRAAIDGKEKLICKSLFSWVNDGSHFAHEDVYFSVDELTIDAYLKVFRGIFERSNHDQHFKMMMGDSYTDSWPAQSTSPVAE